MKKTLSLALSLIMIIATLTALPFTALADDPTGTCGESTTWTYNETTKVLTISGKGAITDASGYESYAGSAEKIIIGDDVTEIPEYGFDESDNAKTISIGASVAKIGNWAFYDCDCLESFAVSSKNVNFCADKGVLYNKAKTVLVQYPGGKPDKAFTTPSSLVRIGYAAFVENNYLETITLNEGLKKIDSYAFEDAVALKTVKFPSTITFIGTYAFEDCSALETATLKEGVKFIGYSAFYDCDALLSFYVPGSATLGSYAVSSCDSLKTLTVGPNKKVLEYYSLQENSNVEEIIIKDGLETIEEEALGHYYSLKKITLPNSIKRIEDDGFCSLNSGVIFVAPCSNAAIASVVDYYSGVLQGTHSYKKIVITPATLKSTGLASCVCTECGDYKTEVLPVLKKNTLTAKGKTVNLKYSKKAQSVKAKKAYKVAKAQGKVSYKIAKKNKNFKVAKNGKITVKKGLKKGTYKIKVKVTAAGNISYAKGTKTVTVKVVIK